MNKRILFSLAAAIIFLSQINAIQLAIKLEGRDEHCFQDSLGGLILMRMNVMTELGEFLEFSIKNTSGTYEYKESGKNLITFQAVTQEEGMYKFCFQNIDFNKEIHIYFDYKTGVDAKDYTDLISKEEGVKFNLSVKKLEDTLHDIGGEKRLIVRHQQYNNALSNELSFKIQAFSIITGLLLLALGIFQSYYLKQFFKEKKMI